MRLEHAPRMAQDSNFDQIPTPIDEPPSPEETRTAELDPERKSRLLAIWEELSQAGLADAVQRVGTNVLLITLILVVAWVMRQFYQIAQVETQASESAAAASRASPIALMAITSPVAIASAATPMAARLTCGARNAITMRSRCCA